jgi:DNA-binding response OmpR family regulator
MSNVLVVDDDPDARTLLEMALGAKGHVVFVAANGAEALPIARAYHPDIILLDLAMPVMDGFAFRAAQLLEPELADIPVICVSGRHDSMQVARTLHLADCVSKPFGLDEVIHRVERLASSPGSASAV